MNKIILSIKNCSECPFWVEERVYTSDSFEMIFKWTCAKSRKVIREYVEFSDKIKDIPNWCKIKDK